jgi:hypothetical protein
MTFEEMFETEIAPAIQVPTELPFENDFRPPTGAGDRLCRKILQAAFVRGIVGDIEPSTTTYRQQPEPTPSEEQDTHDDSGEDLCDCNCARCQKDECHACEAESKCAAFHEHHAERARKRRATREQLSDCEAKFRDVAARNGVADAVFSQRWNNMIETICAACEKVQKAAA